ICANLESMMKVLQQVLLAAVLVFSIAALPATALAKTAHHAAHAKPKPAEQKPAANDTSTAAPPTTPPAPHAVIGNEPTPPPPTLDAKGWRLMDYATGQVLAETNADARAEPASITKVMTAYIVSAELAKGKVKLDDQVFISENAWRSGGASTEGSTSFLA